MEAVPHCRPFVEGQLNICNSQLSKSRKGHCTSSGKGTHHCFPCYGVNGLMKQPQTAADHDIEAGCFLSLQQHGTWGMTVTSHIPF